MAYRPARREHSAVRAEPVDRAIPLATALKEAGPAWSHPLSRSAGPAVVQCSQVKPWTHRRAMGSLGTLVAKSYRARENDFGRSMISLGNIVVTSLVTAGCP